MTRNIESRIRDVARAVEARQTQERAAYARSLSPVVAWSPDEIAWFRRPLPSSEVNS